MRALSLAFPWVDLSGNSHVCLCCPGPVLMPPSLKLLGLSRQMWDVAAPTFGLSLHPVLAPCTLVVSVLGSVFSPRLRACRQEVC